MKFLIAITITLLTVIPAIAQIETKSVEYHDGDTVLEGFVAWNTETATENSPGVLVVHQWTGLTDYEKGRCKQLAELGYVAFALDIYGKGVRPENTQEAGQQSTIYKTDRVLYRQRLNAGLAQLLAQPTVDTDRIAAIGYCFGGTGVLELARSGANINGVVSFHGGLDSPTPDDGQNIKCKLLVCHGADDPFVPADDIAAFKAELIDAKVDWQMNVYSQAVHAFTQPMAGNDNSRGFAYNKQADNRSWEAMRNFFNEVFKNSVE